MPRQAFLILALSILLVAEATEAAQALPKSFCRRWAAGVANNAVAEKQGGAPVQVRPAEAANEAGPDRNPNKVKRLAGGGMGGTLARLGKSADWNKVYRMAYAHCRVVEN